MHQLKQQPFYLAFTDGWGDEPIVRCEPLCQSSKNPRLVVCAVDPPIGMKQIVVFYDRFSDDSWLPLKGEVQVGVLLGDIDVMVEPDVGELELAFWATLFSDINAAKLARERLLPRSSS